MNIPYIEYNDHYEALKSDVKQDSHINQHKRDQRSTPCSYILS